MLDDARGTFAFLQQYAHGLLADIDPGDFCKRPTLKASHPAWLVGHLCVVYDRVESRIGGEPPRLDERWRELFVGGSEVQDDASLYPGKHELVEAYDAGHARLDAFVGGLPADTLAAETFHDRSRPHLPTVGGFLTFLLTAHEATHLGQLSAWRRGMGRDPLF